MFDPAEDGITHINIYSRSLTKLGRLLSNWDKCHIETSIGKFYCIEGLIFFLGSFDDRFRKTYGFEAKKLGEELDRGIRLPEDVFKRLIVEAMNKKVWSNDELRSLLKNSTLPLTHYYTYGKKVINIPKWQWQVDEWEKIRKELQSL